MLNDGGNSNSDTDYHEDGLSSEEKSERLQQAVASVVQKLTADATREVNARTHIDQRWLRQLRQFHGIYEKGIEGALTSDGERSKVFINVTRPKTNSWEARLFDLLFPADEKNYGVGPTPVPDLTDAAKMATQKIREKEKIATEKAEQATSMAQEGADRTQIMAAEGEAEQAAKMVNEWDELQKEAQDEMDQANRSAELMEREIDDQLTEADYPSTCRKVIRDSCKLGSGILKGPVTSSKAKLSWVRGEITEDQAGIDQDKDNKLGEFELKRDKNPRPDYRHVAPWHFFPDSSAIDMDDCGFTYERHLKNRRKFIKMGKLLGFDKHAMREILREGVSNDGVTDLNFITHLRDLEGESNAGTNSDTHYIVWEYHGELEQEEIITLLRGLGQEKEAERIEEEDDPLEERMIVAYFCQGKILKIAPEYPMDSGENLYNVFSFEKSEASILGGVGIPWLMRHEQSMLNSSVRLMIDNGALGSIPQTVIDETRIQPENGLWKIIAGKIWKKTGQEVAGTQDKPFEFFNVPVNQQAIAGIIELALKFIDDVVSMPMIAQGDQGQASQTLGGMSMLFNSANVVFRRVVKNWDDDMTTRVIRRLYHWNMQFSDKEEIKGDMQVEARGTSVLLVREIQSQQLIAIATNWSSHPVIGPAIKVWETLRMTLQALAVNPDDIIKTKDEFEKSIAEAAAAAAENGSPETINAQSRIEVAQISAQSREAESQLNFKIAEMNRETEIMKLIQKDGVDMSQIQAMLAGKKMDNDSKERGLAVEAALEGEAAEKAESEGRSPTGSGGAISLGSEEK